ncbi:hypothetical protein RJ55_00139 [Drechmeria coniospora]|nr:hypothetical protein RJ55_00139 [Drechmeria coniospora]
MNSKNWNDRADKDLFFTILSVKNIGVISGAEWTTIGNHMRTLGYGFTNEGCRQHFQGLRRVQNKMEADGIIPENARRIDPTLNPITRRPRPGRGRPRKEVPGTGLPAPAGRGIPAPVEGQTPAQVPGTSADSPQAPEPVQSTDASHPAPASEQAPAATAGESQPPPETKAQNGESKGIAQPRTSAPASNPTQPPISASSTRPDQVPQSQDAVETTVDVQDPHRSRRVGAGEEAVQDDEEEHPAKRVKTGSREMGAESENDAALDDEAVLALAAHNGSEAADQFENYDEA